MALYIYRGVSLLACSQYMLFPILHGLVHQNQVQGDAGGEKEAEQQTAYRHAGGIPATGNSIFEGVRCAANDSRAADPGSQPKTSD